MNYLPWIIVGAIALLAIIVVAILSRKKGCKSQKPDYYAFFIMGIVWLAAGIPLDNYGLSGMGLVFMIIGLAHRDEWKENRRCWKDMDPKQKRLKLIVFGLLALTLCIGIAAYLFVNAKMR